MKIELHKVTWYSWTATAIVFVLTVFLFAYLWNQYQQTEKFLKGDSAIVLPATPSKTALGDPLNGTYMIDSQSVTLVNGMSDQPAAPESSSDILTQVFGQPVYGDISGDGKKDAVFFVAQQTGGTGTFFYVIAAMAQGDGYVPTNAIFLGDRIAPQNIDIVNGVAEVNYAVRKDTDPMTEQPSIGVTKYLYIKSGSLFEKPTTL